MSNKFLRFVRLREQTPVDMDGHRYRLDYEIGEGHGGSFRPLTASSVDISTSGTLQAVWNRSDDQMSTFSGTTAIAQIQQAHQHAGPAHLPTKVLLNTYSVPHVPPDVQRIAPGTLFPLDEALTSVPERPTLSFLSDDISETRDEINALSKGLWGDRLLFLSQERSLFDMYKSARNADEFRARVQSLSTIAKDINRGLLRGLAGLDATKPIGDFVLLETVLLQFSDAESVQAVTGPLKALNNLRQGYPAHGDNADKFLPAHRFFGIPYPVEDHAGSWETVLAKYFAAMRALRALLAAEWKRQGIQP